MNNPIITASGAIPAYACVKVSTSGSERVEVATSAADVVFGVTLAANTAAGGVVDFQTTDSQLDIFTLKAAGPIAIGQYVVPTTNGTVIGATTGPFVALDPATIGQTFTARKFNAGATANFLAPGTGATTRTLDSKLGDIISVKDFGAVGDGSTDDTAAINTAIDAALAGSGNLYFPAGVYAMSSALDPNLNWSQIPLKTITRSLNIWGDQATIRCTRSTEVVYMMYFFCNGFNFRMSGITFNQNQKAWIGIRVEQAGSQSTNIATIDNCTFENSYKTTTRLGGPTGTDWASNCGLQVAGGFRKVAVTNCTVQNNSRAINTAIPGGSSTLGIFISSSGTFFAENVYVSGCLIQNILNDEVGALSSGFNFDTDGLSVFGGFSTTNLYTPAKAIITNNTFINCKGRSIKLQVDEVIVANNTVRFGILPCGNSSLTIGGMIDAQGLSSTITGNTWHFDPAPGNLSPFNVDGTATPRSNCCGSFMGSDANGQRPRSIIIENNTVYNNVPQGVGVLANFCDVSESPDSQVQGANAQPSFISIKGNRVLGGTVEDFAVIGFRTETSPGFLDEGKMYANVNDNHASKMLRSLIMTGGGAMFTKNFITCIGNTNASGTDVAHLVNGSTGLPTYPGQFTAMNNQGIGLLASKQGASDKSFLARMDGFAPSSPVDDVTYGAFSIQTANVASGATHTFPRRYGNVDSSTFLIIGSSIGGSVNAMFSFSGSAPGSIVTAWANSNAAIVASGPPASTASKLNIGRNPSGDNEVQIINGFSPSARAFTLYTFG